VESKWVPVDAKKEDVRGPSPSEGALAEDDHYWPFSYSSSGTGTRGFGPRSFKSGSFVENTSIKFNGLLPTLMNVCGAPAGTLAMYGAVAVNRCPSTMYSTALRHACYRPEPAVDRKYGFQRSCTLLLLIYFADGKIF
jgi:hypothetical protein